MLITERDSREPIINMMINYNYHKKTGTFVEQRPYFYDCSKGRQKVRLMI